MKNIGIWQERNVHNSTCPYQWRQSVFRIGGTVKWSARPKGPRGWDSWGGGSPPPHQQGALAERCKLPQWGPVQSSGRYWFWYFLNLTERVWKQQLLFSLKTSKLAGSCLDAILVDWYIKVGLLQVSSQMVDLTLEI